MPRKLTRFHSVNQQHLSQHFFKHGYQKKNTSPQPCELFLVKFCKLSIIFFTYYTVRALTLQNDVTWCYEKTYIFNNFSKTCSTKRL